MELNTEQRRAVEIGPSDHCVVTACPGSGKTRLLSARAAYLLPRGQGNLVAVTFTHDAAGELRNRIVKAVGEVDVSKRLAASTFHSLALDRLKRHYKHKRGRRLPRLLSGAEQAVLLRRAWELYSEDIDFDDAQVAVEYAKSTPSSNTLNGAAGQVYHAYAELLRTENAWDFADLILNHIEGMKNGSIEPIAARWMLVDEAQDMDEAQYEWVMCHARAGATVMVVGDDDQSIYGWRNALGHKGMMRFVKELGALHLCLSTNYRCSPEIIDAASRLIYHNTERADKQIRAYRQSQGMAITIKGAADAWSEAKDVANEIVRSGTTDWAVLARTNMALRNVATELARCGIEFYQLGGYDFWSKEAPAAYLAVMRSLGGSERHGLFQALYFIGMPSDRVQLLQRAYLESPATALNVLPADDVYRRAAQTLFRLYPEWQELVQFGRVNLAADAVTQWFVNNTSNQDKASDYDKDVFMWCTEAFKRLPGTIPQRLNLIALPKKKDHQGVGLMTLHSSKGLEFRNVWIIGFEEGVLPHVDAPRDEERRLAYVGMTRAKDQLYLSYCITSDKKMPSNFLTEAGLFTGNRCTASG